MADFWSGFGAGFVPSANQAADRYQRGLLMQQELDLRKAADARAAEAHGLQMRNAQRVDDATTRLTDIQTRGIPTPAEEAQYGPTMPFRKATERELNAAMQGLAAARGDSQGLRLGMAEDKRLNIADRFKNMTPEQLEAYEQRYGAINTDGQMPFTFGDLVDSKGKPTGFKSVDVVLNDGKRKQIPLDAVKRQQLALAYAHMEEGDVATGLQIMSGIDKDLYSRAKDMFSAQADATRASNDAYSKYLNAQNDAARTRIANAELGVRQAAANKPNWVQLQDAATGEPRYFDVNSLKKAPDGSAALPPGLKMPARERPQMNAKETADALAAFTESFGGDVAMGQRALAVHTGRVTPEMAARAIAGDPPAAQIEEINKWASVDPAFAAALAQLLRGNTQPTPAAPAGRPGLPAPIIAPKEPPPALPTPTRGVPIGQRPAALPWEQPTGSWR
jgi:hypothetical protein